MDIRESVSDAVRLQEGILTNKAFLSACEQGRDVIAKALLGGKKVLIAGNGGSAADAQHFAAEFVATFKKEKRSGYPVLALTTDTSYLTAWTNDFGCDDLFAREVQTWGASGDVFIGISTSGNSKNIFRAMQEAKRRGMRTIALLGGDGGIIKGTCDIPIVVPAVSTARIQEVQMLVLHVWCEEITPQLV
jgi:D-sedoheptulose 7-phosphate isomerase